jgi:hypothetical protein
MGVIAYGLRDEFGGEVEQVIETDAAGKPTKTETVPAFTGGLIRLDAERELNLREALDENDGVIVIDDGDQSAIVSLDGVEALKRVAVPDGAEPVAGDYDSRTNDVLRAELNRGGVHGGGNKSHDELVAALGNYDELNEAGKLPADLTVKSLDEAAAGARDGEGE